MKTLLLITTLFCGSQKFVVPSDTLKNPKNFQEEIVFTSVEQWPSFPGGTSAMYKFLGQNIKYPKEAMENKKEGRVYLKFIIEKDGSITHIELMKGMGYGCDLEAIRVVSSMPKWIPGKQGTKAVRCYYNLPIVFRM